MTENDINTDVTEGISGVPKRSLLTYARLWQLETWLRRMVYVELRALRGDDWTTGILKSDHSFQSDKRLVHMPTPEMNALSYAQLSTLKKVIDENWILFEPYLPPQNIWKAKLEEVEQIRHRVAHFRLGHEDDLRRVIQFLRDLDQGFWRFCTSYNDPQPALPPENDPVTAHFLPFDPFPWTEISNKKWARVGSADRNLIVVISVELLQRAWTHKETPTSNLEGRLYDVHFHARDGRCFIYDEFLKGTSGIHNHCVHICLSSLDDHVRVTIPAVLGNSKIIEVIQRCFDVAKNAVTRSHWKQGKAQMIADEWPEHVLGPEDALTLLTPEMPCSIFEAQPV